MYEFCDKLLFLELLLVKSDHLLFTWTVWSPIATTYNVPELHVVADHDDLLRIVVYDRNETLGLHAHPAFVNNQLVDLDLPEK